MGTLTLHGTWDLQVPYSQAEYLHEALDSYGVPNLLVPLYGWGHGFDIGYNGAAPRMHRFAFERFMAIYNKDNSTKNPNPKPPQVSTAGTNPKKKAGAKQQALSVKR